VPITPTALPALSATPVGPAQGPLFHVWFVNLFVAGLLRVLRLRNNSGQDAHSLSTEELRTMVLESGTFIPPKHRSILLNLFELEDITVEDVMTPATRSRRSILPSRSTSSRAIWPPATIPACRYSTVR
jgi:CBS domain containing-hemolysin-like protein